MALFNVHIGSGTSVHRPVVRPNGVHWMLLAMAPVSTLVAALGDAAVMLLSVAVWIGFFYACWIFGRWVLLSAARFANPANGGMAQGYGPTQHYAPNPYPHYAYPPQQQRYPPHPPQQSYEPPRGWAPPEAQHHDG